MCRRNGLYPANTASVKKDKIRWGLFQWNSVAKVPLRSTIRKSPKNIFESFRRAEKVQVSKYQSRTRLPSVQSLAICSYVNCFTPHHLPTVIPLLTSIIIMAHTVGFLSPVLLFILLSQIKSMQLCSSIFKKLVSVNYPEIILQFVSQQFVRIVNNFVPLQCLFSRIF